MDGEQYSVQSQSDLSKVYNVDISTYTCTCLDFPLISYCKHVCAVQRLFNDPTPRIPLGSKSDNDTDLLSSLSQETLVLPLPEEYQPVPKP
jgi:hypothetical protein